MQHEKNPAPVAGPGHILFPYTLQLQPVEIVSLMLVLHSDPTNPFIWKQNQISTNVV